MVLHQRTHPHLDVPGCYGCKVASVGVSAEAMPNRFPEPNRIEATEKRWHKDHAAYKRLSAQGYKPAQLDGSAYREARAVKRLDIEHPHPTSFGLKPTGATKELTE